MTRRQNAANLRTTSSVLLAIGLLTASAAHGATTANNSLEVCGVAAAPNGSTWVAWVSLDDTKTARKRYAPTRQTLRLRSQQQALQISVIDSAGVSRIQTLSTWRIADQLGQRPFIGSHFSLASRDIFGVGKSKAGCALTPTVDGGLELTYELYSSKPSGQLLRQTGRLAVNSELAVTARKHTPYVAPKPQP